MLYGHRIAKVEPLGGRLARIYFKGGQLREYDFSVDANKGGFFADILEPAFFEEMSLSQQGAGLEWPSGLGYCADYLWLEGQVIDPEESPTSVTATSS